MRVQLEVQFVIFSAIFIAALLSTLYLFNEVDGLDLAFMGIGVFIILLFLFLILRERDKVEEAVIDTQFEKDHNKKMKAEAELRQYQEEKDLLKTGVSVTGDLTDGVDRKKKSIKDIRNVDRKLEKARRQKYEAERDLKAYDSAYSKEYGENLQKMTKFELDSIINRDMKEIQGKIDEILARRTKDTEFGKLRLQQLRGMQDKVLKRQAEVAKLSGDSKVQEAYDPEYSNIKLRNQLAGEMERLNVNTIEEFKKKKREMISKDIQLGQDIQQLQNNVVTREQEQKNAEDFRKYYENLKKIKEQEIQQQDNIINNAANTPAQKQVAANQKLQREQELRIIEIDIDRQENIESNLESEKTEYSGQLNKALSEKQALAPNIKNYDDAVEPGGLFGKLDNPRDRKVVKVKVGDKTLYYKKKDDYTRAGDVMSRVERNT
jgi:preprotein translocase subunit YajC